MYQLYKIISFLSYPLIRLLLLWRVFKGKEDSQRYTEKLGYYKISRPHGKLIWFHAASIGEFNAILPVIKAIADEFPSFHILVTTVTLTAAKIAKNNLPNNAIHQFVPLDCTNIVERFIEHWQPDLVIWTESEFWPNMIVMAAKKAKLLLINARLSEKSFTKWNKVKSFAKTVLHNFDLILAQSKETKLLLEKLGIDKVIYSGNLKFVAANFAFNAQEVGDIQQQLENKVILMAASTHPGEEEIFAQIQCNLKQKYPQLFMVIAPRHPHRKEEVSELFQQFKLKFITRSSKEAIEGDTDILLVDTIGEFGLFYRLSEIVCVGGSWNRIGHSFIEPAKLKNLIIFGPRMDNSREVADDFLARQAALTAADAAQLEKIHVDYLAQPEKFTAIKDNGEKMVDEMNQIKAQVLERIKPYLLRLSS